MCPFLVLSSLDSICSGGGSMCGRFLQGDLKEQNPSLAIGGIVGRCLRVRLLFFGLWFLYRHLRECIVVVHGWMFVQIPVAIGVC